MKVLMVMPVNDENKALLEASAPGSSFIFCQKPSDEDIISADIILGNLPAEKIMKNKNLKWLQTNSAGVEQFIKPGVLPKDCKLTNATGGYGLAISEHLMGMYLELIKKLHFYRDNQKEGCWKDCGGVASVYGSTVLILGLGDIGSSFAKICKAMGAYVIGVRRTDASKSDFADEVHLTAEIDDLLPKADCVAIALPGTPETAGMFGAKRISKMKDGAVLLNVGRGSIVDTEALCDALESGKLSGAGLDVTEPEPLPENSRLWKIDTAVITPHVSGGYHLHETHERIVGICAENLRRFLAGEQLKNTVDFTTGYRKLQ